MAIKELLELVGSDVVIKQLGDVQKKGEESLAVFNKPLPELKFPDVSLPDPKPIEDFNVHIGRLKDVLHTLRPILQAAGLQISEFGAFARLASGSVVGLATALAGAVVLGLAKLEENAARTKGQLTDLFGSSDKGEAAFAALGKQAQTFGTTVDSLAPGLAAFQTALNAVNRTAAGFVALKAEDLPGAQIAKNADAVTEAYGNFIKLLRAGRQTQDEAEKSAKAFFDTLKEGGAVTSAALKNLPVGTINLLKEALGAAGLTTQAFFAAVDQGAISVDKLQQALLAFGPQSERAFQIKAIKTFGDEIGKLLATLSAGFERTAGKTFSDFVIGELTRVRQGIQDTIDEFDKIIAVIDRLDKIGPQIPIPSFMRGAEPFVGPTLEQAGLAGKGQAFFPTPEQAGKAGADAGAAFSEGFLKAGFIFTSNSLQQLGVAGANAGSQIAKGIDQANASLQQMRDNAKATGQELQDVVIGNTRFTGRLNQIPVFQPQLAGEVSDTAGKKAGKTFVEAVQSEIQTAAPSILDPFKNIIETGLTVPAEAQQALVEQFRQTGIAVGEALHQGAQETPVDFSNWLGALSDFGSAAVSQAQSIYDQIAAIFARPITVSGQFSGFGGQAEGAPFAGGGMVRGSGTTTSDSILAWLSNREFVVNAKAVSHYGPEFFAALNAMRLPLNFKMGGMARMMSGNKFAAGGMVKGNPVILNIDRKSFNMTAGDDTIAQLKRFAVTAQISSTGRKPRWVK